MKRLIGFIVLWAVCASAQFSVSIQGGEQLEPKGDRICVKLPFNSEYIINLENKDNFRRALVNIRIDGRKATDDGLILRAGETVNLERFIDSGTLTKGKKFKFVDRAEAIADGRKENNEDGFIIVSVQHEKPKKLIEYSETFYATKDIINIAPEFPKFYLDNMSSVTSIGQVGGITANNVNVSSDYSPGVTEEGTESHQRFQEANIGELESQKDEIVIKLVGYWKEPPILIQKEK